MLIFCSFSTKSHTKFDSCRTEWPKQNKFHSPKSLEIMNILAPTHLQYIPTKATARRYCRRVMNDGTSYFSTFDDIFVANPSPNRDLFLRESLLLSFSWFLFTWLIFVLNHIQVKLKQKKLSHWLKILHKKVLKSVSIWVSIAMLLFLFWASDMRTLRINL